jgi:hypothetical protein
MLTTAFTGLVLTTYFIGGKGAKYANKEGFEVVHQMSTNNSFELQINSLS